MSRIETLKLLLDRVQSATVAGNFQLECDLAIGLGLSSLERRGAMTLQDTPPAYSRSVDAALTLLGKALPGWHWRLASSGRLGDDRPFAIINPAFAKDGDPTITSAFGSTPALAICAAILKAHISAEQFA